MTLNILSLSVRADSDCRLVDSDLVRIFVCVCDSHAYAAVLGSESDIVRLAVLVSIACSVVGHVEILICSLLCFVSAEICVLKSVPLAAVCP